MHSLHHGDAYTITPDSADVVITDPPYGNKKYPTDVEFDARMLSIWTERYRTVAVFGYPELLVRWCVRAGLVPDEWVTWWPTNKMPGRAKRLPRECEAVAIFGETPNAVELKRPRAPMAYGRKRAEQRGLDPEWARLGDVWRDASPGMACNSHLRQHPNEKPVSLMERLVILCTQPGAVVFDPFMGSGTTGVACVNTGRAFVGIERDAGYYAIAERRIAEAQMQTRMAI